MHLLLLPWTRSCDCRDDSWHHSYQKEAGAAWVCFSSCFAFKPLCSPSCSSEFLTFHGFSRSDPCRRLIYDGYIHSFFETHLKAPFWSHMLFLWFTENFLWLLQPENQHCVFKVFPGFYRLVCGVHKKRKAEVFNAPSQRKQLTILQEKRLFQLKHKFQTNLTQPTCHKHWCLWK